MLTLFASTATGCLLIGILYAVIASWFEGRGKK